MSKRAFLFLGAVSACFAQSEYFPLHPGNQWVYRMSGFAPGEPVVVDVRSTMDSGGRTYAVVRGLPEGELQLRVDESGLLLRRDPRSGVETVWADFSKPAGAVYETAINPCNRTARVESRQGRVSVPAGEFENALVISYPAANCADAGLTEEAFLPYIGLIRRTAITIGGPRSMNLVYARIGGVTVVSEPELAFGLSLDRVSYAAGETLRARLTLRTPAPVDLEFGTSQRADIVIRNESGTEVARWSDGKAFLQVLGIERVPAGERNWALEMPLILPPGRYTAEGFLATTGGVRFSARAPVTVTGR